MMVRVCALHAAGKQDDAADLFDAYLPLVRYEQQPGIGLAVRKYVLHQRGVLNAAFIRKPGNGLSASETAEVERLINRQAHRLSELA
jgi:4-hydroxy-tetrahydrodipicolinate synthase